MLETDSTYITILLIFWAMINLSVEYSTGLFFAELKGTKNIIKVSLAAFMIAATACLYLLICTLSQHVKGMNEEDQRNKAIKLFNEKGRFESDSEDEREEEKDEESSELKDKGLIRSLLQNK
jgi:hypothetical protein